MGTNNTISTDNRSKSAELFLADPRLWEDKDFCPKNRNLARKIEISPEKIDDVRIWGRLKPSQLPGSYAYDAVYKGIGYIISLTVNNGVIKTEQWTRNNIT